MAKVKIISKQDNRITLVVDDDPVPYNVLEYSVHQENGKKPVLTFLAPMSVEVDSLELIGTPEQSEPAAVPNTESLKDGETA